MIRRLLARLITWALPPAPPASPIEPETRRISQSVMAKSRQAASDEIAPYEPPPGVLPVGVTPSGLGMDSTPYDYLNSNYMGPTRFRGYPYLAMLSQVAEYRKMSETIAKYMTKKFIKVISTGDGDKSERIEQINCALKKFKVREVMYKCAEMDGFFGRGQIYIDVKKPQSNQLAREDLDELRTPLLATNSKVKKDSLVGFTNIDPMWTYPAKYNSTDPMRPDYYRPSSWFIMGKEVHSSRLLSVMSREVPDILKASYNFGGMSLSQLAEPVINNWLRTRDSVSDTVHSFSLCGVATNLSTTMQGGDGSDMMDRAELFNNMRDNRGLMLVDKETEEYFQVDTSLSGLAELQSQAQEMPAAVANIPLVFLLGITPNGMNATSEGEIEVFFSYIKTMQESLFNAPLKAIFDVIQLSEFGDIDDSIGFEYLDLSEMDLEQAANIEKTKAETDGLHVANGAIAPQEVRDRLIADENNAYHGLAGAAPEIEDEEPEDDETARTD